MSYPNLQLMLRAANRREAFVSLGRVLLRGLAIALISLIVALGLDATFAFPPLVLVALDVLLVTLFVFALGRIVKTLRATRFDARRLARRLETDLGVPHNALINAVDLQAESRPHVSRALVMRSVAQGEDMARKVDVRQAIQTRSMWRALMACAMISGMTAILFWVVPDLFARGLPRLFDPHGDHPPFTLIRFDVGTEPETIYYGSSGQIHARLAGPGLPDRADVVVAQGDRRVRFPMASTEDGFSLSLSDLQESMEFYVDTPKGRSDWHRLEVLQVPLFEDIWVTYHYPEHTDWAPVKQRLQGRDVEAIIGTRVTFQVQSNLPLESGQLKFFAHESTVDPTQSIDPDQPSDQAVRLVPQEEDSRVVSGEFVVQQSGHVVIDLKGVNHQAGPDIRTARVQALADQPPQVTIPDPEPLVFAVEDWKIPVEVEAHDDVQVEQIELTYAKSNAASETVELDNTSAERRRGRARFELDLSKLDAKAGEEIRLFATARDNHPGSPQTGDSSSHVIRVISNEEFLEHLRTMYQMEQLEAEIAELTERLDELGKQRRDVLTAAEAFQQQLEQQAASGEALSDAQQAQKADLQKALDALGAEADQLRQEVADRLEQPQLYEMEESYREQLDQLQQQLSRQQQTTQGVQETLEQMSGETPPTPEDVKTLREALEQLQQQSEPFGPETRDQLARNQAAAEQMRQAQQMMQEVNEIQQVMQQQRDLSDRMQAMRDASPLSETQQQRADQLARQQETLNQQLEDAQRSLRKAAEDAKENLPKASASCQSLCDAIDGKAISSDQQQAAQAARQGRPRESHDAASQAADKLESLASSCPNPQGMAGEIDGSMGLSQQDAARTLEQLTQAQSPSRIGSGQSGSTGRGSSLSEASSQRNGRQGVTPGRVGLRGPQPPQEAFQGRRRGSLATRDEGDSATDAYDEDRGPAERIDAQSRGSVVGRAGNLRGVPVGYLEQAEAYFQRLSQPQRAEQ